MKEIDGDLIALARQGHFDVIAHGCNCQNIMGAGIADQIREHFPRAYKADRDYLSGSAAVEKLGNLSFCVVRGDNSHIWFTIFNLYTQFNPGKNLSYPALELSLWKLNRLLKINYPLFFPKVGLPKIGCGIAGGDWKKVKAIIARTLTDCEITIVNYKPE